MESILIKNSTIHWDITFVYRYKSINSRLLSIICGNRLLWTIADTGPEGQRKYARNINIDNFSLTFYGYILTNYSHQKSVAVVWSVESLPSNPAGSGILISILGLGVCPLSVFCPVCLRLRPWHCVGHTFREVRPWVSV